MRSSTIIDQTRRKYTQQWEICVRDLKAAKIGLNSTKSTIVTKQPVTNEIKEPTKISNSSQNNLQTNASSERLWPGVLLGRLRPRAVQLRRRCVLTGRGRGVLRRFRRSRIKVREHALRGDLACVRKRTW